MVKIIEPRIHSVKESYRFYLSNAKEKPIPYWMYKEILSRVCKKASMKIIMGEMLNLQSNIGYLRIKKIKRNFFKAVPDWGASNREKAALIAAGKIPKDQNHPDGEEWMVFYSDPWYLRWAWMKGSVCRVKNQSVYLFRPTANRSKTAGDETIGKLGNRGLLVLANRKNPTLHNNYDY